MINLYLFRTVEPTYFHPSVIRARIMPCEILLNGLCSGMSTFLVVFKIDHNVELQVLIVF